MTWRGVTQAVALAVFMCANTLVLRPLIDAEGWLPVAWLTVVVLVATSVAIRTFTRSNLLALLGQTVVALPIAWSIAAPATVVAGFLPTGQTWSTMMAALAYGVDDVRQNHSPVPDSPGLRCMLIILVALITITADAALVELHSPVAAWTAILVLHTVPMVVMHEPTSMRSFLTLAGTLVGLLLVHDLGRLSQFLPLDRLPKQAIAAAIIAAIAAAGATMGPRYVEPSDDDRLVRREAGPTITINNPMFDLRDSLTNRSGETVLTYTTTDDSPAPLRLAVVDSYDGTTFGPTTGTIDQDNRVQEGLELPPGQLSTVTGSTNTSRVTLENFDDSPFLPVPDSPRRVAIDGNWLWDTTTLNILGSETSTESGMEYEVTSKDQEPTLTSLGEAATPNENMGRWLETSDGLPEAIASTAREVAGNGTQYDQAVAIQDYFRQDGGFSYSLNVAYQTDEAALDEFLRTKSGYCIHYSTTMALMARSLGIPARVVVGYLPGTKDDSGRWQVTGREAHAWPELYFVGNGWVRFEPTPSSHVGGVPQWTLPESEQPADEPSAEPAPEQAPAQDAPEVPEPQNPGVGPEFAENEMGSDSASTTTSGGGVPWWVWLFPGLLLLVLLPVAVAWWWSGRRLSQAVADLGAADATWRQLLFDLADLGIVFSRGATVTDIQESLTTVLDDSGATALAELADAVRDARYGAGASDGVGSAGSAAGAVVAARPQLTATQAAGLRRVVVNQVAAQTNRSRVWLARALPGFAAYL